MSSASESKGAGTSSSEIKVMQRLTNGGYGRVYEIPETPLGELKENLQKSSAMTYYGELYVPLTPP